jgi:hypothetical protein
MHRPVSAGLLRTRGLSSSGAENRHKPLLMARPAQISSCRAEDLEVEALLARRRMHVADQHPPSLGSTSTYFGYIYRL